MCEGETSHRNDDSVKGIKEATLAEIAGIIGNSKANLVYEFFKTQTDEIP